MNRDEDLAPDRGFMWAVALFAAIYSTAAFLITLWVLTR